MNATPTQDSLHTDGRPSSRALAMFRAAGDELEQLMLRGETPDFEAMSGWEYRGRNVAFWAERAPIRKFIKGFYTDGAGQGMGYNVPVVQNPDAERWIAKPHDDDPKRFGFYTVKPVDAGSKENAYLQALLLNYSEGGNFPLDPSNVLRDYLVRVVPGSDDLILGKALLALGPARVASNYFVLERHRPTRYRV